MIQEAIEKLEKERKGITSGHKEFIVRDEVARALTDFCRQNEEFAQAVVQGGSFRDCLKAVLAGVTNGISDIEAYRRAVRFYFPGAEIRMSLSIELGGEAAQVTTPDTGGIVLDLSDFL